MKKILKCLALQVLEYTFGLFRSLTKENKWSKNDYNKYIIFYKLITTIFFVKEIKNFQYFFYYF